MCALHAGASVTIINTQASPQAFRLGKVHRGADIERGTLLVQPSPVSCYSFYYGIAWGSP